MRGNPWSNAGSQWAPPPKPPTARNRPPPPSAGARRYDKFDAPKQSSSQWAYEGAEARKGTYEAWEHMRGHAAKPSQTKTAPKPPPREVPKPAKDYRKPAPKPAYEEYRDSTSDTSPHRRTASSHAAKKGFMPNTPGGDEPAAPKGSYYTTRTAPPEPPPRTVPTRSSAYVGPDPLQQFRDGEGDDKIPNLEKRYTPYATHGGEKLNPFESANLNRSKSTREPSGKTGSKNFSRVGSDPNLSSANPRRPRSFADGTRPKTSAAPKPTVEIDSDSSEDEIGPKMNGNAFGRSRASMRRSNGATASTGSQQVPNANEATYPSRKPKSKISQFQQWRREHPDEEPDVDSWHPDGPPLRANEPTSAQSDKDKMYGSFDFPSCDKKRTSSYSVKLPTVSEKTPAKARQYTAKASSYRLDFEQYPTLFPTGDAKYAMPSGVASGSHSLNAFEGLQRGLVDQLLSNKSNSSSSRISGDSSRPKSTSQHGKHPLNGDRNSSSNQWQTYRDPSDAGSPSKKSKPLKPLHSVLPQSIGKTRDVYSTMPGTDSKANYLHRPSRFTFPIDQDTFQRTRPAPNGFTSNSAENISTKFAAEDWAGKFEAGTNFFNPDPKAAGAATRGRAQSASRSRVRSPFKVSTGPKFPQPSDSEVPIESPGGTKFSAEEWAQYFKPGKPDLFAPAPSTTPRPTPRKGRGSVARPTMGGKAAVVDDSETPDEKPLFDAKTPSSSTPFAPSPDAMDVDTPPINHTVPQFAEPLNSKRETLKRTAAPSQSPSADAEDLKVNFDDMKIQDLISSLNLPSPPLAPTVPQIPTQYDRPNRTLFDTFKKQFAKYMEDWDLFNNKYLLHLVARKNQVDALGPRRWEDEDGVEFYRRGLREDDVVLKHWQDAREVHEKAVKEFVVVRERMRTREAMGAHGPSPRKKTH